jgi:pimeloyl-ACP methyl ester carboxylesterase
MTETRLPGLVLTDHEFDLPLDQARPDGPRLTVYAREAAAPDGRDRPWLLFLQGGPGSAGPRPVDAGGWLGRAVRDFRVLLLDQRGTGRSSPATRQTLAGMTPERQAAYLAHFRADAIVEDAEAIRRALCGDGVPWSLLGQSFGGFCIATYLSRYPDAVREAFVTGGLPPLTATAADVYRATFGRMVERNRRYYTRYPDDAPVARRLLAAVRDGGVRLPDGDPLTEARLRLLGLRMGFRTGLEQVHYLLERAFVPGTDTLSDAFLHDIAPLTSFATNPLYAVLHEPIYGAPGAPTGWAADRVLAEFDAFAGDDAVRSHDVYFTGEMIFRSFLADQAALRPLAAAADLLAARADWPPLYDVDRLRACQVPVAAIVYHDDIFVDAGYSLATARTLGNCRVWVTNEFEHDGLQDAAVLDRLIGMARGLR